MKEIKIAKLELNIKCSKNYRESICAWLHEKAEEIKNIKEKDYVKNPKWNYIIND